MMRVYKLNAKKVEIVPSLIWMPAEVRLELYVDNILITWEQAKADEAINLVELYIYLKNVISFEENLEKEKIVALVGKGIWERMIHADLIF